MREGRADGPKQVSEHVWSSLRVWELMATSFIDDVAADRSFTMNSEVNTALPSAHIQLNATEFTGFSLLLSMDHNTKAPLDCLGAKKVEFFKDQVT